MATFNIFIDARKRDDGMRAVRVRLYHLGKNTSITTPFLVDLTQATKGGKIKDAKILDACNALVKEWRDTIASLGPAINSMSAKELATYLKSGKGGAPTLNFVEYMRKVATRKRARHTTHNYRVVAASFEKFLDGRPLDINSLTPKLLTAYEQWLRDCGKTPATILQYMTRIKSAFNAAIYEYNDDDGDAVVLHLPFRRYKMPTAPAPIARSVDLATLQAIADLPTEPRYNSRRNFGRDIMMISFALGGINYVDLYNLTPDALHYGYIEYRRQKTRYARADEALYRVCIHPDVYPLLARWTDPTRQRLFNFHRLCDEKNFGARVAYAVKEVEKAVPYPARHYTYYAARHTYASLAHNLVGIDKYTVHELLNHIDDDMKITDRYIERDWQRLFDAHKRIVGLIDWRSIVNV